MQRCHPGRQEAAAAAEKAAVAADDVRRVLRRTLTDAEISALQQVQEEAQLGVLMGMPGATASVLVCGALVRLAKRLAVVGMG